MQRQIIGVKDVLRQEKFKTTVGKQTFQNILSQNG